MPVVRNSKLKLFLLQASKLEEPPPMILQFLKAEIKAF